MKNRFYTLALVFGLAPGFALAQQQGYPSYPSDQNRGVQQQPNGDDQNGIRHDRDDQRMNQDYDRGTQQNAGNLDNLLHRRYPNSNIAVNYQDNNTVVLTGTAATGHDRKDAEDFVRSQLGNARVIDQIQVTGYGREGYPTGAYNPNNGYPNNNYPNTDRDRDRDSGYNQSVPQNGGNYGQQTDRDRNQQVDRDRDRQMPQSDADANRDQDRDRTYANDKDKDKDKDKHHKDKKHKDKDKDKNKDRDRRTDQDQQPH
jgi:hypothetical protein